MNEEAAEGWPTAGVGHNSGEVAVEAPPKFEVKYPGQPDTEEAESFRLRRNAELQAWLNAKPILANATKNERDLRDRVTSTMFPMPTKGTQRYDIGGGYKVKLVHGLGYTLGNAEAVDADNEKISKADQVTALENSIITAYSAEGEKLLDRLIKWTPELSGTEWEKLNKQKTFTEAEEAVIKAIGEILTVKPAAPQLTFEEPKEAE